MDLEQTLAALFWATAVAALAPLLTALLPGRVPQVVLLLAGGVLVGPEVLGLADTADIQIISDVGLGFLFLLAGYELDVALARDPLGRLALVGWVFSLLLALGIVGLLAAADLVRAFVPVALGLTTTALGTLLPILREHALTQGVFGRCVLAVGAVGEILPVTAIALFLGTRSEFVAILSLVGVAVLAASLTLVPRLLGGTRIASAYAENLDSTSQSSVRATVLLLVLFLAIADRAGLDVVLGAFLAGMVLRQLAPGDAEVLERKLDVIGYGFFIPIFFVCSGMNLDVDSIVEAPVRLLVFFVLLLVVRGLPTVLVYRRRLALRERVELGLVAATALPLLVALTQIGLENGTMLPENAAALVGAGALSVLVFPTTALALRTRRLRRTAETGTGGPRP